MCSSASFDYRRYSGMCTHVAWKIPFKTGRTERKVVVPCQYKRYLSGSEILKIQCCMKRLAMIFFGCTLVICSQAQQLLEDIVNKKKTKKYQFEEVDFEDM